MARRPGKRTVGEELDTGEDSPPRWGGWDRLLTVVGLGVVLLGTQLPFLVMTANDNTDSYNLHQFLGGDNFLIGEVFNNDYAVPVFCLIVFGTMIVAALKQASMLTLFLTGVITGLTFACLVLVSSLMTRGLFSDPENLFGQGSQMGLGLGAGLMLIGVGVACFGAISSALIREAP